MPADIIKFPDAREPKTLTARDRLEALLMSERNLSVVDEFPNLEPGVRALLVVNAELLVRLAR